MKYIVLAISGAADHPSEELGGKTPFEVAKIPNLQALTKVGRMGSVSLVPMKLEPSSDTTILNLLGYDSDKVYTGRGPIEAANLELELEENEIPFRMNFITESNGNLADPTAGGISTKEAKALINYLNKKIASDFVRFYAGAEYRHIAVFKDSHGLNAFSARTRVPDEIIGRNIDENFPEGPGEELLKKMMYDARLLLQDHEINQVRVDLKENPANMIWLWGQGASLRLESFNKITGLQGAMIAGAEYAKGIARVAGLKLVDVPGATGGVETDYLTKGDMLTHEMANHDLVFVHVGACDEAARTGALKAKVSALEGVDYYIISRIKEYLEQNKDSRVLITPGHASPWQMRRHVRDSVPFVIAGKNIMADDVERFSELTAKAAELSLDKGSDLMPYFLAK